MSEALPCQKLIIPPPTPPTVVLHRDTKPIKLLTSNNQMAQITAGFGLKSVLGWNTQCFGVILGKSEFEAEKCHTKSIEQIYLNICYYLTVIFILTLKYEQKFQPHLKDYSFC